MAMMMMPTTVTMKIMMRVVVMGVMLVLLRKLLLSPRAVGPGARRSLGERRPKSTVWAARRSSQEGLTVPVTGAQGDEHRDVQAKLDQRLELACNVIVDRVIVVGGLPGWGVEMRPSILPTTKSSRSWLPSVLP